jgi:acetyltransferase-like isoleucine patch superfamily enzyme
LRLLGEVSFIRTIYWNLKLGGTDLPILLFRNVRFRAGPGARLVPGQGRLQLGCRWDMSRFHASDFKLCEGATLEMSGQFRILTGCSIDINRGAVLSLGSGFVNNNSRICVFERVTIGLDVVISEHVTIRDSDNHSLDGQNPTAPITIGNRVWIGMNSTILKGVTVGDGAVIAANSLVNRDVPPQTLVAGVPARVVRRGVRWT